VSASAKTSWIACSSSRTATPKSSSFGITSGRSNEAPRTGLRLQLGIHRLRAPLLLPPCAQALLIPGHMVGGSALERPWGERVRLSGGCLGLTLGLFVATADRSRMEASWALR
jgi:hypothetical protein